MDSTDLKIIAFAIDYFNLYSKYLQVLSVNLNYIHPNPDTCIKKEFHDSNLLLPC